MFSASKKRNFHISECEICETCLLNDSALDPNDRLVPRVTKKESFNLDKIPDDCLKATFEKMNQVAFTRMRRTNKVVSQFIEENRERINISLFHNWIIKFGYNFECPGAAVSFLWYRPRREESYTEWSQFCIYGCGDLMDRMEKILEPPKSSELNKNVNKVEEMVSKFKRVLGKKKKNIAENREMVWPTKGITHYPSHIWASRAFYLELEAFRKSDFLQREFKGNYRPCFFDVHLSEDEVNMAPFIEFLHLINHSGGTVRLYSVRPSILNGICDNLKPSIIIFDLRYPIAKNTFKKEDFSSIQKDRKIKITEEFAQAMEPGAVTYLMTSFECLEFEKVEISRKEQIDAIVEGLMHWKLNGSALKSFIFSVDCHFTAFVYFKRLFAILDPVDLDTERCIQLSSQYPKLLEWIPVLEEVVQHEVFKPNEYFYFEGRGLIAVVTVRNEKKMFQMTVL